MTNRSHSRRRSATPAQKPMGSTVPLRQTTRLSSLPGQGGDPFSWPKAIVVRRQDRCENCPVPNLLQPSAVIYNNPIGFWASVADRRRTVGPVGRGVAITAVIFFLVGGFTVYSVVRFRGRAGDEGREAPQVFGSTRLELAWTILPLLIVLVIFLVVTRTVIFMRRATPPQGALTAGWRASILVDVRLPPQLFLTATRCTCPSQQGRSAYCFLAVGIGRRGA